jgi:hypothetical protein
MLKETKLKGNDSRKREMKADSIWLERVFLQSKVYIVDFACCDFLPTSQWQSFRQRGWLKSWRNNEGWAKWVKIIPAGQGTW